MQYCNFQSITEIYLFSYEMWLLFHEKLKKSEILHCEYIDKCYTARKLYWANVGSTLKKSYMNRNSDFSGRKNLVFTQSNNILFPFQESCTISFPVFSYSWSHTILSIDLLASQVAYCALRKLCYNCDGTCPAVLCSFGGVRRFSSPTNRVCWALLVWGGRADFDPCSERISGGWL